MTVYTRNTHLFHWNMFFTLMLNVFILWLSRNSIPSTVTLPAFNTKLAEAGGKCHVDVGFWGGIVPGNEVLNTNKFLPV